MSGAPAQRRLPPIASPTEASSLCASAAVNRSTVSNKGASERGGTSATATATALALSQSTEVQLLQSQVSRDLPDTRIVAAKRIPASIARTTKVVGPAARTSSTWPEAPHRSPRRYDSSRRGMMDVIASHHHRRLIPVPKSRPVVEVTSRASESMIALSQSLSITSTASSEPKQWTNATAMEGRGVGPETILLSASATTSAERTPQRDSSRRVVITDPILPRGTRQESKVNNTKRRSDAASSVKGSSLTSLQQQLWSRTLVPYNAEALSLCAPRPVSEWPEAVQEERDRGQLSIVVARQLIRQILQKQQPELIELISPLYHNDVPEVSISLRQLACRTAVAAYLLTLVEESLPRHQESVQPYVRILLDFVFVPDTPDMRRALGGTVQDEALLDYLADCCQTSDEEQACDIAEQGTSQESQATQPPSDKSRSITNPDLFKLLCPQFTRKSYGIAQIELSRSVIELAHQLRCQQLHERNVQRLIVTTQKNWMKSLMRAILRVWHRMCVERRLQEQRQRVRWSQRWTTEWVRIALRRWRGYAGLLLKSAEANSAARIQLAEKKAHLDRLVKECDVLYTTSNELNATLQEQEHEREVAEQQAVKQEQVYKMMMRHVREVDRVGTLVLSALLLPEKPPAPYKSSEESYAVINESTNLSEEWGRYGTPLHHRRNGFNVLLSWSMDRVADVAADYERAFPVESDPDRSIASNSALEGSDKPAPQLSPAQKAMAYFDLLRKGPSGNESSPLAHSATSVAAAVENTAVPFPYYLLLLLMRAFEPSSCREGDSTTTETEDRFSRSVASQLPSLEVIHTVQVADTAVLKEYEKVLGTRGMEHHDSANTEDAAADPSTSNTSRPDLSLMHSLSEAAQHDAQSVCKIVVDSYEQLTEGLCVVTPAQLFGRTRDVILVFIAGLFRHYTNWIVRREQQVRASEYTQNSGGNAAVNARIDAMDFFGVQHNRYPDWAHPPRNHQGWVDMVTQQATWVSYAFTALHLTVQEATAPQRLMSAAEQERVNAVVEQLSLSEFVDLLPPSQDGIMEGFVNLMQVVEMYAQPLYYLFHHYALPLSKLKMTATSKGDQPPGTTGNSGDDGEPVYITGYTLWRLLRDAGVAGGPKVPMNSGGPPTLPRPAVLSLVEQLTQRGLPTDAMCDGQATSGGVLRRSQVTSNAAPVSCSVKMRLTPCFARAIREDRHIDLRSDSGAVCLSYLHFVKLLIRLSHAWQCQRGEPLNKAAEVTMDSREDHRHGSMKRTTQENVKSRMLSQTSAISTARSLGDGGSAKTPKERHRANVAIVSEAGSSLSSPLTGYQASRNHSRWPSVTSLTDTENIAYSPTNYQAPLHPSALQLFLGNYIIPSFLAANRSQSPARTATYAAPVLQLFAQNHDALHLVFTTYQQAREARGIRGTLPPPFSTAIASHQYTNSRRQQSSGFVASAGPDRSSSRGVSAGRAPSRRSDGTGLRASISVGRESPPGGSTTNKAHSRVASSDGLGLVRNTADTQDVAIVSVMRLSEVNTMAKELNWFRERRITEKSLQHCFENVVADTEQEGNVIFYPEFLDLLCALAPYYDTSPAVPLHVKLKAFLEARVLVANR